MIDRKKSSRKKHSPAKKSRKRHSVYNNKGIRRSTRVYSKKSSIKKSSIKKSSRKKSSRKKSSRKKSSRKKSSRKKSSIKKSSRKKSSIKKSSRKKSSRKKSSRKKSSRKKSRNSNSKFKMEANSETPPDFAQLEERFKKRARHAELMREMTTAVRFAYENELITEALEHRLNTITNSNHNNSTARRKIMAKARELGIGPHVDKILGNSGKCKSGRNNDVGGKD
jgi:hypothetical protein